MAHVEYGCIENEARFRPFIRVDEHMFICDKSFSSFEVGRQFIKAIYLILTGVQLNLKFDPSFDPSGDA